MLAKGTATFCLPGGILFNNLSSLRGPNKQQVVSKYLLLVQNHLSSFINQHYPFSQY